MKPSATQQTMPACLWMQAGVVKKKYCYTDFCCENCRYDRAMRQLCCKTDEQKKIGLPVKGNRAGFVFWKDRLRQMPFAKRPCIHTMKGQIGFTNCTKSYHCLDCELDQYFHDQFKIHTILKPMAFERVQGISLPAGYYVHPGHTWVKIEKQGMVRMGIDDFACCLLGKCDTITAPVMGKKLAQGKPAFCLSRQGHKVFFVSPVNGIITDVNARVRRSPGLIHGAPYTDGWVFMIYCPDLKQDLKHLLFQEACKQFIRTDVNRLTAFIQDHTQVKAADGGTLVSDMFGNLPQTTWDALVKKFIPQES